MLFRSYPGSGDYKPLFFGSEEAFLAAFREKYCLDIIKWDEMTNDDLTYWADRIDEFLEEFPYYTYSRV